MQEIRESRKSELVENQKKNRKSGKVGNQKVGNQKRRKLNKQKIQKQEI